MSHTDHYVKPEHDSLPSAKTDPPYMANIDDDDDASRGKPSLYQRLCMNQRFQMFCRIFQMLSSIISFIVFTVRYVKIANDVNRATTASNDAVLGILVAAVVYDISSMIGKHFLKNGAPNVLRIFWAAADIAFVVAFIMVAELTSPGRGMSSGPCHTILTTVDVILQEFGINCELPIGTFVMAIFSTILHTVTAIFNPIWSAIMKRRKRSKSNARMGV